jgi:hypothetical protein
MQDDEYLREKEATERDLVMLPNSDKLRVFDSQRKIVLTMTENLSRATPEQRREFVLLLVERAVAYDKGRSGSPMGCVGAAVLRAGSRPARS